MPQAVDSNSTLASKIHPEFPAHTLRDLSDILRIQRAILDCLIEKTDRRMKQEEKRARQDRQPAEDARIMKTLRNDYILKHLRQGIPPVEIAAALNMRLSFLNRIIENLYRETSNFHPAEACPEPLPAKT